jgi:ABC-type lipoprotein export system ATPase subunit
MSFIEISSLWKSYWIAKNEIPVLKGVNLSIKAGEWITLLGASGSGKTTLLNLIGTLETIDKGDIIFNDKAYSSFSRKQFTQFRNHSIGYIFQAYHMLPELSVIENVMLPGMLANKRKKEVREKAIELLESVGLSHRLKHKPNQLSGGEQQRAAIARALINSPQLLLADEPTGNLDSKTGESILQLLTELHKNNKDQTIIMVTHDERIAHLSNRIIRLKDGTIL